MGKIKTRDTLKDIKTFDRAADIGTHMKNAFLKSKDAVESADRQVGQTQDAGYSSPSEYASDHVTGGAKDTAERAAQGLRKNPVKKASENVDKAKQNVQEVRRQAGNIKNAVKKPVCDQPKKEMVKRAKDTARRTASRTRQAADKTIKTMDKSGKTIKQAAHGTEKTIKTASKTVKGTARTAQKGIKTAERTARVTVKTAQQTAKATQRSAQAAAKAAKMAAHASKVAAKAAVQTAKAAVKVTIATIKAIIAALKALIAAIAAGGWVAVVIILIICMIGLLVGSIFGIFFSGEDAGNGYTMPMAIQEINQEYADKIKEIRDGNSHDDVQMSGSRAEWKEILAVYAVKVNTDPANAQDVATMDEDKKELLRSAFWDMNTLSHRTETKEVIEVTVEGDGDEDFISTETTVTKTILYITVSHKTAAEMAEQYGFTAEQQAQLTELLSEEYADLWSAVLYGIHNGSGDIVAVAISQLGNVNGEPYWIWYGFEGRVEWCACFVSWCANECGYIEAGIVPKFAACTSQGMPWFKERGLWQEAGYVPAPGDIIFFDWDHANVGADHVGIVEYVEGEVVHTIEGNTSNSCARRSYRLDSENIRGYGTPMY
ncbi:MAG TPA: CHAP domain-containing protein [Ruminococcaceae bacterium]|nr:CHAP domain-containing protein [Oscillospiraceae bacterium]